jgi:hypothetical protein
MMSNGPPAHPDGTVDDVRWLFPQERPHKSQNLIYKNYNNAQLSVLLLVQLKFLVKHFSLSNIFTPSIK